MKGAPWQESARRFGPALLWVLMICVFSTSWFSSAQTERLAMPILHWLFPGASLDGLLLVHAVIRKSAHVVVFGILGLLLYRALGDTTGGRAVAVACALFLAIGFAGLDEFHQRFVPSRTSRARDVGWDGAGATLALTLRLLLSRS